MKKDSKIYIAGHRGLVGSAIWKNLANKGYRNLMGKTSKDLDLTNQKAVTDFFEKEKPEYVFLAAAKVGGILANNTYRGQFIYENIQIQNNVIHQSYVSGVKKLLFLGSTCIYPKNAPQPMMEDYLLTDELEYTNEPYAIAKIAGLKMCESYNLQYGTNFISVMPTNLYGSNDNFNLETSHVLPAIVRKMHLAKCLEDNNWREVHRDLNRRPIEGVEEGAEENQIIKILNKYGVSKKEDKVVLSLWGTGKPLREFLWSEDMADACVFLMENREFKDVIKDSEGEVKNTHINIGTGKEVSIKELSELVKDVVGFKGIINFDDSKPDGTMRKLTNPSKLNNLGWKHRIELEEGVRLMYTDYIN